jgi:hypothetical protein
MPPRCHSAELPLEMMWIRFAPRLGYIGFSFSRQMRTPDIANTGRLAVEIRGIILGLHRVLHTGTT